MKKNICLTIHSLSPKGGEERMCTFLANSLYGGGRNVIVVTLHMPYKDNPSFCLDKGVKYFTLCGNRFERRLFKTFPSIPLWRYKRILKKHKIDVVIDVDIHQSLVTTKAVKGLNIKVISWDHFNYDRFIKRPTRDVLHECFINDIDKLVVLTKSDKKAYVEQENIPESLVCQIYNPSPITTLGYTQHDEKKVIAIGRLSWQKGFDMLLEAWRYVEMENTGWVLEIVGDGECRNELNDLAKELELKNVLFSQFTPNIKQKYELSSIYVLSSRYEGFPLVLTESQAHSLPIISFDCKTGPDEIITDGYDGFLVEQGNTKEMANKILLLIRDDKLRERMSHNSYESSQIYRIENVMKQWNHLIDSI